jgi:hypothetical protein
MLPKNCPASARNTVRFESERCPTEIGTLSDINWNHCPVCPGIRTGAIRTYPELSGAIREMDFFVGRSGRSQEKTQVYGNLIKPNKAY